MGREGSSVESHLKSGKKEAAKNPEKGEGRVKKSPGQCDVQDARVEFFKKVGAVS